ncbi:MULTISPECIES: IclR family transcriptional regulator [unclassified Nocardioides]|uniref:IclR family transcriptional regulator n=1 Tax=unclassified Nocardioides TaxID=2615069 RepID=UPI0026659DF9|nr:IclR family transcriptional regulator [Nocardioides sp. Arc9.136]WKN47054.1 IclR family transcriptional regulator [Nocardioides sp. Arc9.136]
MPLLTADEVGETGTPVTMVERMTLILDAFGSARTRLSLEQVAAATALPRSTAHRILEQMVRLEWADHSPFGYALGRRAQGLARRTDGHLGLREAAAPHLHELHVRTGLVVHLAVLEDADVSYLDKIGGPRASTVPSRVGRRLPAHRTALGRAMLACLDSEDVDVLVGPALDAEALARFHHELHRIRGRHGLAFERGAYARDVACVAAPVRYGDGQVAALSLVGDATTPLTRVAPLVVDAARSVGRRLADGT